MKVNRLSCISAYFTILILMQVSLANAQPFVKVCNSGQAAGTGTCPTSPLLGAAPAEWGCTWDVGTKLLWQTFVSGMATNFDDATRFQGFKSNTSAGKAVEIASITNSIGAINDYNTNKLCSFNNWRRPTKSELHALVVVTNSPQINHFYFPMTYGIGEPDDLASNIPYLTSTPTTSSSSSSDDDAFGVYFYPGLFEQWPRNRPAFLRAVSSTSKLKSGGVKQINDIKKE